VCILIAQNDVGYVRNHAGIVCGAVDVVDRDWLSEGAHGDVIKLCPLDVNETTSGAAVNEGLSALSDRCQGTPVAYPPVTGQGCLNRCGLAKAG
jgi:hypothetical protein